MRHKRDADKARSGVLFTTPSRPMSLRVILRARDRVKVAGEVDVPVGECLAKSLRESLDRAVMGGLDLVE